MEIEIKNVAEINPETQEQGLAFNKLKAEEKAVYELLCPQQNTRTAEQIAGDKDIPDRIKELVEKTKDRFYKYEIWEAVSSENKDPIIIGREQTKDKDGKLQESWYDQQFFLGRWGEELENFLVLKEKAITQLYEPVKIELLKIQAQVNFYLADVPLFMKDAIKKGRTGLPSFNNGCLSSFN